jgi:hypothetical protein
MRRQRSSVAEQLLGVTGRQGRRTGERTLPDADSIGNRRESEDAMLRKLLALAGVGALLALVLACGFGGGGDDDDGDDDDDFAPRAAAVSVR